MEIFELNGIRLHLPDDVSSPQVRAKLHSGDYEGFEAKAAMKRVKPGNRVLELGAGLGYISAICARAAGPENVLSVEANPRMLDVIRSNLALNGFSEVRLVHAAVSEGEEKGREVIPFHAGKAFWGGSLDPAENRSGDMINVPLLCFGDLMDAFRPHVVIMDIEGGEARLFDRPWPVHVRRVMMELHPNKYPDTVIKRIVECMSESGLTYDPVASSGRVIGFKRVQGD
ncbi:FkbM family methyltransferase [Thalassovita sp.]|uniref:FkbM family methyltransferase n=1 Tax=Thalassovita sp. TaxID=1979401 RepID=UPI002B27958A|nr:FkbM family methyltransferase [Thalassovita sp.]